MLSSAAVPCSHIRLHFKRSTPTVATLQHARRALLRDVSQQLEDLDRWIKATGIPPKTYGDQLCAAIIEHRSLCRAATALNAAGVKTVCKRAFTSSALGEWVVQPLDPQVNPLLLDLARRLCLGGQYNRDRKNRQFASSVRAAMEVRS